MFVKILVVGVLLATPIAAHAQTRTPSVGSIYKYNKPVISSYSYPAITQKVPPVIRPSVSRPTPNVARPRNVDHRNIGETADHTSSHNHSHDSIGVRQIITEVISWF